MINSVVHAGTRLVQTGQTLEQVHAHVRLLLGPFVAEYRAAESAHTGASVATTPGGTGESAPTSDGRISHVGHPATLTESPLSTFHLPVREESSGRLFVMGAFAEFKRSLMRER